MAESTGTSTTSSGSSNPPTQPNAPTGKQYIRASVDDNALEPDALRGSDQVIKDSKVQDDEADRRKVIEAKDSPKPAA